MSVKKTLEDIGRLASEMAGDRVISKEIQRLVADGLGQCEGRPAVVPYQQEEEDGEPE